MNTNNNSLLSKKIVDKYDYGKCKEKVLEILRELEEARYIYGNMVFPNISPNLEIKFNSNITFSDKTSKYVEVKFDTLNYINEVNRKLEEVVSTFTKEEKQYFIQYLLYKKSEDYICEEIIFINKNSLIPIKESCIVKLALSFGKAILKNIKGGDRSGK